MGFMDNVKKAAGVAKLQGELLLIDRQITACKEKHGVAVYNILAKRLQTRIPGDDNDHAKEELPLPGLQAAFQAATEDLFELNQKRNQLDDQIEVLQDSSSSSGAKKGVSGFFTTTKLKTELAYYEREIKLRQGIFGHQLFDDLQLMSHEGNFQEDDDMVGEVLNQAKEEMQTVLKRKQDKEAEIEAAKAVHA